ncbi:cupin domain-containing protein [Arhodomonas sp. SL1]|uniref:cupin domain-containing protein n=1 Tax=Arhodomonas sp. SL1 TaxID=3425691 RepID=UPI003F882529
MENGNLFYDLPQQLDAERFDALVSGGGTMIERIVSTGQTTPPGQWYDQERAEWVVVLRGSAGLRFEGEDRPWVLTPGDWMLIPAHRRHRVEWTHPDQPTVWLAVHFEAAPPA